MNRTLNSADVSQQTILYPDSEITTQCFNGTSYQDVIFKFVSQSTVYDWSGNSDCLYSTSNYQGSPELVVPANFTEASHGFELCFH